MKRFAVLFGCLMFFASPAMAISEFGKQWKNAYLSGDDVDPDFRENWTQSWLLRLSRER